MALILRRVVLVRHGQYDEHDTGKLTPFGRKQASVTARAFEGMRIDSVVSSTLIRAKETAEIIAEHIGYETVTHSALLCECVPTMLPASLRVKVDPDHVRQDRERADRAYERFFRPSPRPRTDLVICHGNIIRFFACRALGVQPRAWIKMQSLHCGITEISVLPNGETRLASYNDTGHLPRHMRTMSNAAAKSD